MCIVYIEELPVAKIANGRVRLSARSDDETYTRIFELALWRQFIENEAARLREYDAIERRKVTPFRPAKRRPARH